jgi:hypothetical protein
MFRKLKYFILLLAISLFMFNPVFAASTTDEAVLGNDRWSVTNGGDFIPNANTYTIGDASHYPSSIWVNGAEYSSFAAGTDGNWTNSGLTTTLDAAPTKFIATHSSGDFSATGFTVGTGDITFANGQKIDGDTDATIKLIEASDTLTFGFNGTEVTADTSDGGFVFLMTQADGSVAFKTNNDADDYLEIKTVANVPTIVTAGTSNLEIAPDGGTTTVTGALTATGLATSAGLTTSSTVTLQNAETIANATNQTVRVSSNAASPILEVYDPGTSDTDAVVKLTADAGADNGDTWTIVSDGATNALQFQNNTSGSLATVFSIPTTGIISLSAALELSNGEQISNAVDDTVKIASDDSSTAVDIYSANTTNGTATLNLIGDAQADATDSFQVKNNADGTLTIGNDSTAAGTYITKASLDSTGAFIIEGSEATAGSIAIWADNGDDAADKFTLSMSAADALTMTTGTTEAISIATTGTSTLAATTVTGATALNGTVGLGNAIGDIVTVTGKVAGATPLSFDGNTADTVYTIIAIDDPASSSKTVTIPAVTGTVKLTGAAVALTPAAGVTLTVAKGTTLYTDTATDNEDQTITFSGAGSAGDEATIIFTTAGTADEVITFHATLVSSVGTLTLGTDAGKYYVVRFISNGTHWFEVSRTAVQT